MSLRDSSFGDPAPGIFRLAFGVLLSVFCRGDPVFFSESLGEIRLGRKTGHGRDRGHGIIGFFQKAAGGFQPPFI